MWLKKKVTQALNMYDIVFIIQYLNVFNIAKFLQKFFITRRIN